VALFRAVQCFALTLDHPLLFPELLLLYRDLLVPRLYLVPDHRPASGTKGAADRRTRARSPDRRAEDRTSSSADTATGECAFLTRR
jgi:hypothetical protein